MARVERPHRGIHEKERFRTSASKVHCVQGSEGQGLSVALESHSAGIWLWKIRVRAIYEKK